MVATTPAIAITSGESDHQLLHQSLSPQPPPKSRQLRLSRRTLLSLSSRQRYYYWGNESVTQGAQAGPETRAQQLQERREEEVSEGREEALPEGSSAGITGGGDCRRDRRRRALTPALSPPVTPALSSSGNACSRPLSQLLRSPLRARHVRGSRGSGGSAGSRGSRGSWGRGGAGVRRVVSR